jgi:hypothetical protein
MLFSGEKRKIDIDDLRKNSVSAEGFFDGTTRYLE